MEIYTPPTLHKNAKTRPVLGDGPQEVDGEGRATFTTRHPDRIVNGPSDAAQRGHAHDGRRAAVDRARAHEDARTR